MGEEKKKRIPTSVAAYRKRHTMLVKGKEGDIYKIRKLPPLALSKVVELTDIPTDIKPDEELTDEQKMTIQSNILDNLSDFMKILLPAVIVEPPVALEGDENTLGLDELNPEDLDILFEAALDFSGLSESATKKKESFRKEQVG